MTDGRGTTKNSNRSQEYHHRTSSYAKMHSTQVAVATTQTIRPQAHKQSIMALMGMIAWITNIGHCCLHSLPCVLTYLQRQTSPPRPYTLHTHVLAQSVVNFCSNANTHYGFKKKIQPLPIQNLHRFNAQTRTNRASQKKPCLLGPALPHPPTSRPPPTPLPKNRNTHHRLKRRIDEAPPPQPHERER